VVGGAKPSLDLGNSRNEVYNSSEERGNKHKPPCNSRDYSDHASRECERPRGTLGSSRN